MQYIRNSRNFRQIGDISEVGRIDGFIQESTVSGTRRSVSDLVPVLEARRNLLFFRRHVEEILSRIDENQLFSKAG